MTCETVSSLEVVMLLLSRAPVLTLICTKAAEKHSEWFVLPADVPEGYPTLCWTVMIK